MTIPYDDLARGIDHGPYEAAPQEIIDHYIKMRETFAPFGRVPVEHFIKDIESEWQYDQHSAAVMGALEARRIKADHAIYMLDRVLRPWFIGQRGVNDPLLRQ